MPAKLTSLSHLGMAIEATVGTAVAATGWIPVMTFKPQDVLKYVPDTGFRGQPVETYGEYLGVKGSTYDLTGDFFPGSGGNLLAAVFGGEYATGTSHGTATTLSDAATVGATSITTAASIAEGTPIQIGTGTTAETHTTTAVTGSGPYTVTLDTPIIFAQAEGNAVQPLEAPYTHNFVVEAVPPSYTLSDYYVAGARQWAGSRCSKLSIKFTPEAGVTYTASYIGFPSATYSVEDSITFGTNPFLLGWEGLVKFGGTTDATLESATIEITRNKSANLWAASNSQSPYDPFIGPMVAKWTLGFYMTGDTEYAYALSQETETVECVITQPTTNYALTLTSTDVQFTKPTIDRSKDYVIVDISGEAVYNSTDTGVITATLANAVADMYVAMASS